MTTARASRASSTMVRGGLSICLVAAFVAQAKAAPDPKAILTKASTVMKAAKTYQATMSMNMSFGAQNMVMVSDIKIVPGKKMAMTMTQAGRPTMKMVDDGVNAYMYFPMMNSYSKGPSTAARSATTGSFADMLPKGGTYKMLPNKVIDGRSAYAIQITLPQQASARVPAAAAGRTMIVYIDQGTGHFRQMEMAGGPQGQSMKMTLSNEKINAPIPDSAFKFTPPAGAKLMKGGPMMGMPGMPAPGTPHK